MPMPPVPGEETFDAVSASFYVDALRPFGLAQILPPAVFRSLPFSQLEDLAIWTRDWVCVGTHDDMPGEGDLLPFTVGTHGLHVQRTAVGLVARFNKAQHGGCRAVPVQCRTGTKTRCSFTSCGHSRDRGPVAAGDLGAGAAEMHQYLGLRPERLLNVAVRSWGPLIFVNLGAAPPDLGAIGASLDVASPFFGNGRGARLAVRTVEHSANWKLLAQALVGDLMEAHCAHGHWVAGHSRGGGDGSLQAAWLFPNLVLLADGAETCAIILQPTAIGQTLCRVSIFGTAADGSDAGDRWPRRIALAVRRAEADQDAAVRWGTVSRPETVGAALPLQNEVQGWWMQRVLARKMLGVSAADVDLQRYQMARR